MIPVEKKIFDPFSYLPYSYNSAMTEASLLGLASHCTIRRQVFAAYKSELTAHNTTQHKLRNNHNPRWYYLLLPIT